MKSTFESEFDTLLKSAKDFTPEELDWFYSSLTKLIKKHGHNTDRTFTEKENSPS